MPESIQAGFLHEERSLRARPQPLVNSQAPSLAPDCPFGNYDSAGQLWIVESQLDGRALTRISRYVARTSREPTWPQEWKHTASEVGVHLFDECPACLRRTVTVNGKYDLGAERVGQRRDQISCTHFRKTGCTEFAGFQVSSQCRLRAIDDVPTDIMEIEIAPGPPTSTASSQAPGVAQACGLSKNMIHKVTAWPAVNPVV